MTTFLTIARFALAFVGIVMLITALVSLGSQHIRDGKPWNEDE